MKNKMTKAQIAVGVLLLGVVGVALYQADVASKVSYKSTTATSTVEYVEPEWASDEDAVKAAQDVINKKRTESELKAVQSKIEALKATYEAELATLVEKETQLEKELGMY